MRPEPNRPARRSAKGQAMAIFALVSVLLFVVAGLAVDAGSSYLTSNKLERAAAAAALAGVAYLPGDIPTRTMPRSSRPHAMDSPTPEPGGRCVWGQRLRHASSSRTPTDQ